MLLSLLAILVVTVTASSCVKFLLIEYGSSCCVCVVSDLQVCNGLESEVNFTFSFCYMAGECQSTVNTDANIFIVVDHFEML